MNKEQEEKLDALALYHAIDHFLYYDNDASEGEQASCLKAWHDWDGDSELPEGFQRASEYEYMSESTIVDEIETAHSVNNHIITEALAIASGREVDDLERVNERSEG